MINNLLATEAVLLNSQEYNTHIYNPSNTLSDIFNKIKEMDRLPFTDLEIYFSSDTWDFSPLIDSNVNASNRGEYILNFTEIPDDFKDVIKFFMYDIATSGYKSIKTCNGNLAHLRQFCSFLYGNLIISFSTLSTEIIDDYVSALESGEFSKKGTLKKNTVEAKKDVIFEFLSFYSRKIEELDYSSILKKLTRTKVDNELMIIEKEGSKTPDIPKILFNQILSTAIRVMNNNQVNADDKAIACMIVLLSQTGLRSSEIVLLKTSFLQEIKILDGSKTCYFMTYISPKSGQRGENNSYSEGKTYVNDLTHNAFITLANLYSEKRQKLGIDWLICPDLVNKFPLSTRQVEKRLKYFLLEYRNEINCINKKNDYPELKSVNIGVYKKNNIPKKSKLSKLKDSDYFSYITPHQFRVHVCTELYYKNVPIDVIQYYMCHLTEDVTDYYIRRPERTEEEDKLSTALLTDIIKDGVKPLGDGTNQLMSKIEEFIEKNNYNVDKDVASIVSSLKRRIPIKLKASGLCIKSGPKRPCSKDSNTDEFYCASGICPNHFHLYWMIDITYKEFQNLLITMKHNETNGFKRQAEHEKRKLSFIVKDRLLPELKQLKEQLETKGLEAIRNEHPNIISVIDNYDSIYKEANLWAN